MNCFLIVNIVATGQVSTKAKSYLIQRPAKAEKNEHNFHIKHYPRKEHECQRKNRDNNQGGLLYYKRSCSLQPKTRPLHT